MISTISIALWNIENFFLEDSPTLLKSSSNRPKENKKRMEVGEIMRQMNADIWCLCEVGGIEAMEWINHQLLESKYTIFFPSITSGRGIDNGILVRKDLNLQIKFLTHVPTNMRETLKDSPNYEKEFHYWKRGQRAMLEIQCYNKHGQFLFELIHTHLKSPVTEIGKDPNGRNKRRCELDYLNNLIQQFNLHFRDMPLFVTGDFNCPLKDPDMQEFIKNSDLKNYLEFTNHPPGDQWSLAQRAYGMTSSPLLIDFMLMRPGHGHLVNSELSGIWSMRDSDQQIMSLPKFAHFRHELPSDHRPQILTLNLPKN